MASISYCYRWARFSHGGRASSCYAAESADFNVARYTAAGASRYSPEAWVQDRTGHKSGMMIAKYRRAARMAAEVGMGPFARMDVAEECGGFFAL